MYISRESVYTIDSQRFKCLHSCFFGGRDLRTEKVMLSLTDFSANLNRNALRCCGYLFFGSKAGNLIVFHCKVFPFEIYRYFF
jgi:hypothetical protein